MLGLGESFQIMPLHYDWQTVKLDSPEGTHMARVLIVETPYGRHGYVFLDDDAKTFAQIAMQNATGLTIATDTKGLGNGKH
jgi:hypothetical protein